METLRSDLLLRVSLSCRALGFSFGFRPLAALAFRIKGLRGFGRGVEGT